MIPESTGIILIPAYMPDQMLVTLTETLHRKGLAIVVVNDGSTEDHAPVFEKVSAVATVICHERNRGKGAAIKTGLQYIRDHISRRCVVVTADADGQHSPEDIVAVCERALTEENTLVLGSRQIGKKAPFRSRVGNSVTRFIFRANTRCRIYDTQTGLRGFGSELLDILIPIEGDRYEYEMKVLLHFARNHLPVVEVPVRTIYFDGNVSSHFNTIKDSFRIYREIFRR